MLSYLVNNWGTILVGVIIAAIVVLVLIKLRKDKKKGKSSCGCDCENCPSSGMCHGDKK